MRGGESVFLDAPYVASVLGRTSPRAFDILAQTPIGYQYINDGHHLYCEHPVIETDPLSGEIKYVNYSPPFQAPLPVDTPSEFYDALDQYAALTERDDMQFRYTLKEGDLVIFDNRRILHARTAFEDDSQAEGDVRRWLKGFYLEEDGLADKGRMLSKALEGGESSTF